MLLLSRKCGQSIVINEDIVVTIVAVDRNRVQIGIRAPGYVPNTSTFRRSYPR